MFYSIGKIFIASIAWLDLLLLTSLLYLFSFLPKKLTDPWYPAAFRYWCRIFIRALGVELKVHQKNLHPLPKQYILIGNHPSAFEDLGMPALFDARFLAKEEIKKWWILGRLSVATRTLYVKRESRESRKQATSELIEALQQGDNICVYPEGGCKGRRIHLPLLYGVFDTSLKSGIPILPLFLHYESQEDFEWGAETLIQKLWKIALCQNKTANYYVFDAIDPRQFETKEAFCTHVENLYLQWQTKYLE